MLKKKQDKLFNKKITDFWALITVVIALAAFFTGKTDVKSFFEGVTIVNFIVTFCKTIAAYAVTLTVIIFSFVIVVDFLLLIFGLKFPIANFLWVTIFNTVVLEWWWENSISQNIFLSVLLIYFIANYDIVTKKRIYSLFYKKVGSGLNGFSISIILKHNELEEGIHVGLFIIQNREENLSNTQINSA